MLILIRSSEKVRPHLLALSLSQSTHRSTGSIGNDSTMRRIPRRVTAKLASPSSLERHLVSNSSFRLRRYVRLRLTSVRDSTTWRRTVAS